MTMTGTCVAAPGGIPGDEIGRRHWALGMALAIHGPGPVETLIAVADRLRSYLFGDLDSADPVKGDDVDIADVALRRPRDRAVAETGIGGDDRSDHDEAFIGGGGTAPMMAAAGEGGNAALAEAKAAAPDAPMVVVGNLVTGRDGRAFSIDVVGHTGRDRMRRLWVSDSLKAWESFAGTRAWANGASALVAALRELPMPPIILPGYVAAAIDADRASACDGTPPLTRAARLRFALAQHGGGPEASR